MFRYERPQKGRLRQFHQIDVEILGAPEPLADVEVIALGARILAELGLADHVVLELNSLGDPASRRAYRDELVDYLGSLPRRSVGGEPRSARAQSAAHPGQQGSGRPRDPGRRAESCRIAERRTRAPSSRRSRPDWTRSASRIGSIPRWCAGSTTTPTPRSSSRPPRSARRAPCWPAAATTGWSRPWAGRTRPASAGPPGSSAWPCCSPRRRSCRARSRWCRSATRRSLPALQLAEELRAAGHHVEFGLRGKVGQRLKRAAQQHARYAILLGEDELARPARSCCATSTGASRRRSRGPSLDPAPACLATPPEATLRTMASAIFDTHAFVKRLTAAGMPVEQAEILADEHARAAWRAAGDQAGRALCCGPTWSRWSSGSRIS